MHRIDYHIHTNFSGDCHVTMESVVQEAVAKGMKEIALTDHVDYDYPNSDFTFLIDYDQYLITFEELKRKYQKEINLILGIEIGFQPHITDQINRLLNQFPFDFVICSTHVADRSDFVNGDFFKGKTQKNAYLRYFENVYEAVNSFNNYDVYGHLDFIIRYGNYENKLLSYLDFKEMIDGILRKIIDSGHGIELNTSGYRYGLNQTHPHIHILKRYKELGGEIITVGSDAHRPKDIYSDFDTAYHLLKEAGFKRMTKYKNRTPFFIEL